MSNYIGESKLQLNEQSTQRIKDSVEKDSWIALRQYFSGAGNGTEAKVACVVIGTLARERQAQNNSRQLDIVERKLQIEAPKSQVVNGTIELIPQTARNAATAHGSA